MSGGWLAPSRRELRSLRVLAKSKTFALVVLCAASFMGVVDRWGLLTGVGIVALALLLVVLGEKIQWSSGGVGSGLAVRDSVRLCAPARLASSVLGTLRHRISGYAAGHASGCRNLSRVASAAASEITAMAIK